jgi:NADH dehydrogenase
VGWIGSRGHIVTGSFALRLREVVDKQYDLLLEGIDTFII